MLTVCDLKKHTKIFNKYLDKGVVETNYFESTYNMNDLFYMSYNEKCFQLFIPSLLKEKIKEMKTGKYAVLTLGLNPYFNAEMIELMFEDFTDTPFSIHLSMNQISFKIDKNFNKFKFKLIGYTEIGNAIQMDVYVRSDISYQLPYLAPIDIKQFKMA